jgi:hypothetical protein
VFEHVSVAAQDEDDDTVDVITPVFSQVSVATQPCLQPLDQKTICKCVQDQCFHTFLLLQLSLVSSRLTRKTT